MGRNQHGAITRWNEHPRRVAIRRAAAVGFGPPSPRTAVAAVEIRRGSRHSDYRNTGAVLLPAGAANSRPDRERRKNQQPLFPQ